MLNNLIIPFPSSPVIKNEKVLSDKEKHAMYELVNKMFRYKVKYYNACNEGASAKEKYKDHNLSNIKVYNAFMSEINNNIFDPFLREFVLTTLSNIKHNDLNNPKVKKSYETFKNWFSLDSLRGKIFKNNLAFGNSYKSINFAKFFELCNTVEITEKSEIFKPVIAQYNKYKSQYEELLK